MEKYLLASQLQTLLIITDKLILVFAGVLDLKGVTCGVFKNVIWINFTHDAS